MIFPTRNTCWVALEETIEEYLQNLTTTVRDLSVKVPPVPRHLCERLERQMNQKGADVQRHRVLPQQSDMIVLPEVAPEVSVDEKPHPCSKVVSPSVSFAGGGGLNRGILRGSPAFQRGNSWDSLAGDGIIQQVQHVQQSAPFGSSVYADLRPRACYAAPLQATAKFCPCSSFDPRFRTTMQAPLTPQAPLGMSLQELDQLLGERDDYYWKTLRPSLGGMRR